MIKIDKLFEILNKHSLILDALYKYQEVELDEETMKDLLEFDLIYYKKGELYLDEITRKFFDSIYEEVL